MTLDEFTTEPEIKRTPSDWGVEGPLTNRCYAFSIRQNNWPACVSGPDSEDIHGAENIDKPWQGVGANANINPRNLTPGTLVVARRASRGGNKPHGAKGLWRYRTYAKVAHQDHVPWTDDDYKWVLYCDPIQREFPRAVNEKIGQLPFHQNKFLGAVNELQGQDCRAYLARLIDSGVLNKESEKAVRGGES